jgi:hypothetical protein
MGEEMRVLVGLEGSDERQRLSHHAVFPAKRGKSKPQRVCCQWVFDLNLGETDIAN